MSIQCLSEKSKLDQIAAKWVRPVETICTEPTETNPLIKTPFHNIDMHIQQVATQLPENRTLLAHETTDANATQILQTGFNNDICAQDDIRSNSIFGWTHDIDIGYYKRDPHTEDNIDTVVLYTAPKSSVYVSSYETSARLYVQNSISYSEYINNHIMSYTDYETLHRRKDNAISHLEYNPELIIP